jgi:hypothetical protein
MNVVLYVSNKDDEAGKRLQEIVKVKVGPKNVEVFHTIHGITKRAHRLPREIDLAVLFAQSLKRLAELIVLKDFFEDIRIILILPDLKKNTISQAFKLYPRYVSHAKSDFEDVAAILEKYLGFFKYCK